MNTMRAVAGYVVRPADLRYASKTARDRLRAIQAYILSRSEEGAGAPPK